MGLRFTQDENSDRALEGVKLYESLWFSTKMVLNYNVSAFPAPI
jgi:hypothetical protein